MTVQCLSTERPSAERPNAEWPSAKFYNNEWQTAERPKAELLEHQTPDRQMQPTAKRPL
jgi:hypothetical protein